MEEINNYTRGFIKRKGKQVEFFNQGNIIGYPTPGENNNFPFRWRYNRNSGLHRQTAVLTLKHVSFVLRSLLLRILLVNFLRSKEYWQVVSGGIPEPAAGTAVTDAQKAEIEGMKLKDLKAKNYLFQAIDRSVLETILCKDTSKQIWDSMKKKYQDYFSRVMSIVNRMRIHGDKSEDVTIVEKILRSMTPKFNFVVCSIEESNDIDELSLDELQSSLLVHEHKLNQQEKDEQALKVSTSNHSSAPSRTYRGRGKGSNDQKYQQRHPNNQSHDSQGRGRGRDGTHSDGYKPRLKDKSDVECYRCHRKGHYKFECQTNLSKSNGERSNFAEKEEEISLLMACHGSEETNKNLWYLDTGCSNHMCGDKSAFSMLDEQLQSLGNGKRAGNYSNQHNATQTISNVLFVPDLKTNLLSIGQLQEKGYEIYIKDGFCRIQDEKLGLIAQVTMTANRMFPLYLNSINQTCFSAKLKDIAWVWHYRYGHLNFGGLRTLQQKNMVAGLPSFTSPSNICEECVVSKQHRDPFPKGKAQRARKLLEIVHSDICGPINPISNGGKRYMIAFIDDFSRKTWNFVNNMASNDNLQQLIHHNKMAFQNMTPEEAWTGRRPNVGHFRIFGCVAYAHIPDEKRKKLDDKGEKCIFLGVSDHSKAYKLYNPNTKRIVVSRDVVFDEQMFWEWNENGPKQHIPADFDGENAEEKQQQQSQPAAVIQDEPTLAQNLPGATEQRPERLRRRPAWMTDYEVTRIDQSEDPLIHFALFADCDPIAFEEAVKQTKWRNAMNDEIAAIERNNTWELTDLPKGQKTIDVKWVYKTKLKENGEVDKYKGRLVAKGYKQEFGIDYKEVFAPVARHDTIRLVIALAAQNSWPIFQLDVKSAFLHGDLEEQNMFDRFKESMMVEFDMSDLGMMHYFLGIEVIQSTAGIFISQKKYVQEILDRFHMKDCNPVSIPTETGMKLVRNPEGGKIDSTLYKQIVGSLIRYMAFPKEMHLLAAKRIFRYLQGTSNYGIMYKKGERSDLFGFTDSDYARDPDDRKNTSGYVFMMGSGAVSWSSKKQSIVTLSTTEAEFIAAAACACQAIWLRKILKEVNFKQEAPTLIYCDNSSTIKLSKNPVLHGRSKHIDVRYHFLRDLTKDKMIDLVYCRSEDQVADIFTKSLKLDAFQKLRRLLGVCSMESSI
ncbi:hypothetical protein Pfo_029267 [Paulownia fortunei]|nr:hypothetical protein Pfo_029267 [Paulownia fortunei]